MSYYDNKAATCKVSVLGTEYSLYLDVSPEDDPLLEDMNGYCDKTVKRIVVADRAKDSDLADWMDYRKTVMRHELIHAFLFESGLGCDSVWHVEGQEHPEQTVDWIARQFPKILKAFQTVGAL